MPLIITVWHIGLRVNSCNWVHALLMGWICNSNADAPSANRWPARGCFAETSASVFFTCKCCNVIINTWHGAWLNYAACLIKGAPHCSSQPCCHLPLSVTFHHPFLPFFCRLFFLFAFISSSPFATFLSSPPLLFLFTLRPVSPPPHFYHSAVFTVIHYHFFRQLALAVLSLWGAIGGGPLGTRKWQKAAFIYLCGPYRVVCLIMWLIDNTVSPLARARTMGNLIHI